MSGETNGCKWLGRGSPRILPGRHEPGCPSEATGADLSASGACSGCLPCPEPHCGVCNRAHAPVTCDSCVGRTRDDLNAIHDIATSPRLRTEAVHSSGVHSEAMMLNGPAANPEAWNHRAHSAMLATIRGTQLDASYLEDCRDENHPLWVTGYWAETWRIHLQHHTDLDLTLDRAYDYLREHMHRMAQVEDPDFAEFATALRACRAHLQAVLHDQNQGDQANIGCFDCGGTLERRLTDHGFDDHWTCRRCHRRYTYAEYNFALRANLEAHAQKDAS